MKGTRCATDFHDARALDDLRQKAGGVPMSIILPDGPREKMRLVIGPGQVAHVAVAEHIIQKKLSAIELDRCCKQGRPVPPELKRPKLCKFFQLGTCHFGSSCQHCHGDEELEVAQQASLRTGIEGISQPALSMLNLGISEASSGQPTSTSTTSGLL